MTRQEVHELIEVIPEERLGSVAAFIIEVTAPTDEESLTESDIGELDEGIKQARAGEGRPLDDVLRDLQL